MTARVGSVLLCIPTEPAKCELCGREAELRPYGPNSENICRACGNKDLEGTLARMTAMLEKQLVGVITVVGPQGQVLRRR